MSMEKYGVYFDLGKYHTQLIESDSSDTMTIYEYFILCWKTEASFNNFFWSYNISGKGGDRKSIEYNGWRTASNYRTPTQWRPESIFIDISDPEGIVRQVTVEGMHPGYIVNLRVSLKTRNS